MDSHPSTPRIDPFTPSGPLKVVVVHVEFACVCFFFCLHVWDGIFGMQVNNWNELHHKSVEKDHIIWQDCALPASSFEHKHEHMRLDVAHIETN